MQKGLLLQLALLARPGARLAKVSKKSLAACKTLAIDKKVVNRRDSLEYDSAGTMQVGLLSISFERCGRTLDKA